MTTWLRWALYQHFLLWAEPTRFYEEVEKGAAGRHWRSRLRYMLKLVPLWIVTTAVLVLGVQVAGVPVNWSRVVIGTTFGVTAGVAFGLASGVGVVGGVAFGVVGAVEGAVEAGAASSMVGSMAVGMVLGMAVGMAFGMVFVMALGVAVGVAFGLAWGVAWGVGVAFVAAFGVAVGVAFGVGCYVGYFRLLEYPFFAFMSLLATRAEHWRWHPLRWVEPIWLPLPGARRFFVDWAKHDPAAARAAVDFVLVRRPLQRRTAVAALMEMSAGDLQVQDTKAFEDVARRLAWADEDDPERSTLPAPFLQDVRSCRQVALRLLAGFESADAHRRARSLQQAVANIESLLHTLATRTLPYAGPYQEQLGQWLTLARESRDYGIRAVGLNPFYTSGNPVAAQLGDENLFVGRRETAGAIESALGSAQHPPSITLVGARRMGKTSFGNQLQRLMGADYVCVSLDLLSAQKGDDAATLLAWVAREAGAALRSRGVRVDEARLEDDPYAAFDAWLNGADGRLPPGLRVLFFVDEYERLEERRREGAPWVEPLLDHLRHLIQTRPHWVWVFCGAHSFAQLGAAWSSRFISVATTRIGFLDRQDVELLLTRPTPDFLLRWDPGALSSVWEITRGHPAFTQALAYQAVEATHRRHDSAVTAADVESGTSPTMGAMANYFDWMWKGLCPGSPERGLAWLEARARGGEASPLDRTDGFVQNLLTMDILDEQGDFRVPIVRLWFLENLSEHVVSVLPTG